METLQSILILLVVLSVLLLPQVVGVGVTLLLRKHSAALAHILGFVIPFVVIFAVTWLMFLQEAPPPPPDAASMCGMGALVPIALFLLACATNLVGGIVAQLAVHKLLCIRYKLR